MRRKKGVDSQNEIRPIPSRGFCVLGSQIYVDRKVGFGVIFGGYQIIIKIDL